MNTDLIQRLVRENIKKLSPYSSARSLYQSGILLDANESPESLVPDSPLMDRLNRYPDGSNRSIREFLGRFYGVAKENIAVGNGSDEIIDLLIRIFCQPSVDQIIILPPTFGMYRVAANVNEVGIIEVLNQPNIALETRPIPLSLPVYEILEAAKNRVKIIFICNPNNPTGTVYRREDILEILAKSECIVVVDEAYSEFMDQESLVNEISNFPNLVVLKTLSKAFALAGIRLGMGISSGEIIELIQKVKLPYNINALTSKVLLEQEDYADLVDKNVALLKREKENLALNLSRMPSVKALIPSGGNFILVRFHNSDLVFSGLVNQGYIVRKVDPKYGLENCLRISVGNAEENSGLLSILKKLEESGLGF